MWTAALATAAILAVWPASARAEDCGLLGWLTGCGIYQQGAVQTKLETDTELELARIRADAAYRQQLLDATSAQTLMDGQLRLAQQNGQTATDLANIYAAALRDAAATQSWAARDMTSANNEATLNALAMYMATSLQQQQEAGASFRTATMVLLTALILVAVVGGTVLYVALRKRSGTSGLPVIYSAREKALQICRQANIPAREADNGIVVFRRNEWYLLSDALLEQKYGER